MTKQRDTTVVERPLYHLNDAARLAGSTASALARWAAPYRLRRHYSSDKTALPLIVAPQQPQSGVLFSFLNLIEAHFIVLYRRSGVRLSAIQSAVDYARREFNDPHPLRHKRFKTDGRSLFREIQEELGIAGLVSFTEGGQLAWPGIVEDFFASVDYDQKTPTRWWPQGRDRMVVVDPRFAFGYPVVAERHVRTDAIAERFEAGEAFDEIAVDFGVSKELVEDAVRYELTLKAA